MQCDFAEHTFKLFHVVEKEEVSKLSIIKDSMNILF